MSLSSRRRRSVCALVGAGLLTSACAHNDALFSDPLFWEGVGLAADLAVVAIVLDDSHGCHTRVDRRGDAYRVCGDRRGPPRRHGRGPKR